MEYDKNGKPASGYPRTLPKLETNGHANHHENSSYLEMSQSNGRKKKKKKSSKKHQRKSPDLKHSSSQTDVQKRVDYVLVYKERDENEIEDKEEREEYLKIKNLRERFQDALVHVEKVSYQEMQIGDKIYVKLSCPFTRLCQEAENINLEMPLKGAAIVPKQPGCLSRMLKTDDEVDFVSAPFLIRKRNVFEGIENEDTFFRPSQRSFLLHNILINMDIREDGDKNDKDYVKRRGLPYMLLNKVYTDSFILHEESPYGDLQDNDLDKKRSESKRQGTFDPAEDPREELHRTWCKCCKYQPLWKIRNYFGEQIAFYFAWAGSMATALWVPMILGIGIWAYGLYVSIDEYLDERSLQDALRELQSELLTNITLYDNPEDRELLANVTQMLEQWDIVTLLTEDWLIVFKNSFDNEATPYFALVICLWGTVFLEYWKRRSSTLAYEWDVNTYHFSEPDRPQFFGTKERMDPVSDLPDWYYPFHRQFLKYFASLSILLFMVLLVIASVIGVITYRVIMKLLLASQSSVIRLLVSSVIATLINSTIIMILGKIYDIMAVKLTDWENHRTQSKYDDALIIKLFAFSFVNTYSSLFYIAFFRELTTEGGLFDMGPEFEDTCDDNNCMAMLSLQVFVLMVMKPCPKFFKDIIVPYLKKLLRKCKCCGKNKVGSVDTGSLSAQGQFIQKEYNKPPVGNFTLGEYNEKVILYGFLMVFSSALPLAPLIALLIILIDLGIDARRLIWFNRRPIGLIACNIGMWYSILEFLNYVGVITNAFIIAFTSQWGKEFSMVGKLWIVIGFEHVVFMVKFFLAYIIPDTPADVSLAMRRERYQVARIMGEATDQGPIESKDTETDSPTSPVDVADNYTLPLIPQQSQTSFSPKLVYGEDGNTFIRDNEMALDQSFGTSKKKKKKKKVKSKTSPRDGTEDPANPPEFADPAYPPQVVIPHPQNQVPGYDWNVHVGHPSDNSHLAYPPASNIYE
ncbi:Anoctamin-7 [Holothuria leucospilota]|uniref:Anoctamin n=1 Tax=Holothuria leucospilota TaxID=206669 RepID=A0A9Q1BK40_HOLLE|nr:Anoctamin-7 [Holothuria leucospilota]